MTAQASAVLDKLCREVMRKIRLASESELKEDREIICAEVFSDVTGELDDLAQEKLEVDRKCRFYEVLAPFLNKRASYADRLLYDCKRLWGQPYMAPVFAMLLHQWLLLNKDAGGGIQRQKHVNVLVSGARQLFWGDVHSSTEHFVTLYSFLVTGVVFNEDHTLLDSLPAQSRGGLLSVVAQFMPYYGVAAGLNKALEVFPSPEHTEEGGHAAGDGADFLLSEVTEALKLMKTESSLLTYLGSLLDLRGSPYLYTTKRATRLNLQAELYNLTSVGGPRYVPRSVNSAAFRVLDRLFPMGRASRRLVSLAFRLWFHPTEWPRSAVAAVRSSVQVGWRSLCFAYHSTLGQAVKLAVRAWRACCSAAGGLVGGDGWLSRWREREHLS